MILSTSILLSEYLVGLVGPVHRFVNPLGDAFYLLRSANNGVTINRFTAERLIRRLGIR